MPTLDVDFLGAAGSGRAPLVRLRAEGQAQPLVLSERARLLAGYLALEATFPEYARREAIQRAVFAGRPANEVDEARRELKKGLDEAGVGAAFRPFRQDAADPGALDPRGKLCLHQPFSCDLAELLRLFDERRVTEAAARIADITKRNGDCRPLELVELDRAVDHDSADRWYGDRGRRLERLIAEHKHVIERARKKDDGESAQQVPREERPPTVARARRWRSKPLVGGLAALSLLVAVAGASAVVLSDGGPPTAVACSPALTEPSQADVAVQRIGDSGAGAARPRPPIVMRSRPRSIVVGTDGVWVAQSTDGSVWLIDPRLEQPVGEPIPVGGTPFSLALAKDVVWVTREDGKLVAIDRESRALRPRAISYGAEGAAVAVGAGSVWVNNYDDRYAGMVSRIDPCGGAVERIPVGERANTVAFAYGSLWVSDSAEKALHRVDPKTNRVTDILLPVGDPQDVGTGGGYVWPVSYGPKRVVRVDPDTNKVVGRPIAIGSGAAGAVAAGGALWLPNYEGNSVTRVDLQTLRSEPDAVAVGISPTDIASGFGRLWVPNNDSEPPSVTAIDPAPPDG